MYDQLLAGLEQLFDRTDLLGRQLAGLWIRLGQLVAIGQHVTHVAGVEESVAFEADVDEGRLHSGENSRHTTQVDVSDHTAICVMLEIDLGRSAILEYGYPGPMNVAFDQ